MSVDKAFEDEFLKEGSQVLKNVIPKMVQIWKQLGFPQSKSQERFKTAVSHHKELWDSMLEEEQSNKKKIVSSIDRLGRQHHQLCKELGTHYREFGEDMPLLEMEKQLQETLTALNREKEERMRSVRALFQEEDVLCSRLNAKRCSLNRDRIPSSDQYSMLQQVITDLKTEIITRQGQFVSMRDSIKNSMAQLEMSARNPFEMDLLVSDPQSVSLSESDLNKIKDIQQGLISRIEKNQKKVTDMWNTIQTLWERLSVEPDTREIFHMQNRGFAPSTVTTLERELTRLEDLKRQNIERFIHSVRQDLIGWWDRCYVSDAERRNFTPFYAEVYTEDLLELHEAQVERYKELHTSYKDIFTKVHHRENLWKRMEDIEARGRDPSRLFGNRGCALLQEEKERTKIMKELPRVEAQLTELINNYERTNGQVLLIDGQDYRQVVVDQWVNYEEQKEHEKLQRQRERADKLVEEAKGGAKPNTPMKRRLGTTAIRTQMESPKSKQRKLLVPSTAPQARLGPGRRILTEAIGNQPPHATPSDHDVSVMSTYSVFTETLQKARQAKCVNSTVLMDCNTPSSSRGNATPSTLPHRRSTRLAAAAAPTLTPQPNRTQHPMYRRSKSHSIMAAPLTTRLTPARSTPKLAIHKRPFLI
ncbi:protein regulator of cytokinesis 1-like isoform X1 [Daphnia pulicaria]|uniref:protein regulator of cytokinesis 1-like isoform X1 n=1 Tax=Daphnia pulicaria TaxID=35523 RepID=UPI001EEB49D6|nr:protein regulator of cytokinesis 1-like isoform X1 [Daphnia pulicaria]XP_046648071.1 protein regulator of cytokinesis 1-like isoform X1 [Daphnia pulicaria]